MKPVDFDKLRRTVSDVLLAARHHPNKLEGTYTIELANGCRDLLHKVETVQQLGTQINKEIEELGRMANLVYSSIVRMKKMAEVAAKAIGD